ncbi:MAG: L-asparaginase [Gammaproteobacteria bacterium]|jgi:L-asparaginase
MALPRIALIGTGGTISSVGRHPLDLIEYPDTGIKLTVTEILERFPIVHEVADITSIAYREVGSMQIGPSDWLALARLIETTAAEQPDLDGFVITHGTATTEETAYFLNLVLRVPQAVVVVGAQRPPTGLGTDAGINLVNAVRAAAHPETREMGVVVMLNDEIQFAREVTKTSTLRMQTFRTPDFGALGHTDSDNVVYYRTPRRRRKPDVEFDLEGVESLPRVDVAYSYGGTDGTAVDAFLAAGAKGIVSAGFAPGGTTAQETLALERAQASGVVIVQASRAGSGRVTQREFISSRGFVAADNLNPQKARVLLMLALTRTTQVDEIVRIFSEY